MRLMLEENLAPCTTLDELQAQTQETLGELVAYGHEIHHLAGPVSCDGEDQIATNIGLLLAERVVLGRELRQQIGAHCLVLTAPLVFSTDWCHNTYGNLGLFNMDPQEREAQLRPWWPTLLGSGLISGVHFMRRWRQSPGSVEEHNAAVALKIPAYYRAA